MFRMSEDEIERHVERATDIVDSDFMAGKLTQSEYDEEMKRISDWAERKYSEI